MTKQRVVVIGAGMAGLAAAYSLQKQGLSVIVLNLRIVSVDVFALMLPVVSPSIQVLNFFQVATKTFLP